MNKVGRPTLKNDQRIAKIAELAASGKTDAQIAEIVGISQRTLTSWKANDWEFSAILKENKQLADELVEASLFRSATGFSHQEKKWVKNPHTKEFEEVVDERYFPPNPTSNIFWLKNRKPKVWKDRVEVQMDAKDTLMVVAGGNKLPIKR